MPSVIRAEGRPNPQVSVLSVRRADDTPLPVLANYSIHYTSGFESNTVSADYYPCFAERIGELLGAGGQDPPFVGIMSNGNAGNIGPAGGGYEGMRKVGDALVQEVLRICNTIEHQDRVPPAMKAEKLELGVRRPEEKRIQWAHDVLSGTRLGPRSPATWRSMRPARSATICCVCSEKSGRAEADRNRSDC